MRERLKRFRDGLNILIDAGADDIYAEHDVVYIMLDENTLSDQSLAILDEMGFSINDRDGGFYFYV